MAGDDDIAAFLPTPPQPAPARRAAAIEAALRRFDGETPQASTGRPRPARPLLGWASSHRGLAGALISAALLALIGGPIAWQNMWEPPGIKPSRPHSAPASADSPSNATAEMVDASPASPAAAPRPVSPPPPPQETARAAADAGTAIDSISAPAPARPAEAARAAEPAPPPPAPVTQLADARTSARASGKMSPGTAEQPIVTGARIPTPAAPPPAAVEENADMAIAVTGARIRAPRSGDWNACTVDDPRRNLASCRKRVGRAAKGEAGTQLAEGLGLAWEGDTEQAIGAFDRAIAAAPRSSFAYLNRGLAYRRSGDLGRALADLDRAVKLAPGEARNYYNRSLILREQGANVRARRDEQRAVDIDPGYAEVVP